MIQQYPIETQQQNLVCLIYFQTSSSGIEKFTQILQKRQKMQKLSSFLAKSFTIISQNITTSLKQLKNDLDFETDQSNGHESQIRQDNQINKIQDNVQSDFLPLTVENIMINSRPLEDSQLQQSKIIQYQTEPTPSMKQIKKSRSMNISSKPIVNESRIRQIQQEKRRILQQLKKLNSEMVEIKKEQEEKLQQSVQRNNFHKKSQIAYDIEAKKQAQSLIKQLHLQKKKIEEKKRKIQQMQLEKRKKQEQEKRKQRQQFQRKLKQEKRLMIEKRLQEDKRKRQQRKLVQKQSNLLIQQLKKQEDLQKQQKLIPSQILEYEQKKKLLQKKNLFNFNEIQEHQKKYQQMKQMERQLKRQRSESIKVSKPSAPKYGKNIWVEKLQEEQQRKKQQEKMKQLSKKLQLEKRMQYGAAVKSMFISKYKKREQSVEKIQTDEFSVGDEENQNKHEDYVQDKKPRTPNIRSHLPVIQKGQKQRQNKTDKKFAQRQASQSINELKAKSRVTSRSRDQPKQEKRQKDPEQIQRLQKQKQRQLELRRQTKQRLKKLQNQPIQLPKPQKVKYENYMSKVKIKKQHPHEEWKKIMSNQKLSNEQKYKQMLNKAAYLQNQAKIKQDLRKNGDQDAVNLYIGSIQAKLALLQKF